MLRYSGMDNVEFQRAKEIVKEDIERGEEVKALAYATLLEVEALEQIATQLKCIATILNDTGE